MKCPFCGHAEDRVVDSRVGRDGEFIRRRRACLSCQRRYTTYEYIEDVLPRVSKRDGRREPFDRQKLRGSILKACEKRSVGVQAVDDIVAEIESRLHDRAEKETSSKELGESLAEVGFNTAADVLATFIADGVAVNELAASSDCITDDKPALEFFHPHAGVLIEDWKLFHLGAFAEQPFSRDKHVQRSRQALEYTFAPYKGNAEKLKLLQKAMDLEPENKWFAWLMRRAASSP